LSNVDLDGAELDGLYWKATGGEIVSDLDKLVKDAKARYDALTPIEKAVHDLLQRRSGAIGLSRMSLPREVVVDKIDQQPEYVLLNAYRAQTGALTAAHRERDELKARIETLEGLVAEAKKFAQLVDGKNPTVWAKRYIQLFAAALASPPTPSRSEG
jgi:hypothetical protein